MKSDWTYGNWREFGWGALKHSDSCDYLDFDPEFECKYDVKNYWKRRKKILALPEMTKLKYIKTLYRGLKMYSRLGNP